MNGLNDPTGRVFHHSATVADTPHPGVKLPV
jgi:hypothetical protein